MKLKHFLHHLLIPRESNNHRPKLLHHDTLFFVIALFVFVGGILGTIHNNYPQVLGISSDISTQDLLTITNQKRQENGQKPLKMDSELTQAAQAKGENMFAKNYWAHIAPDGTTPWYFIKNAGYEYFYAGENLARGFTTAQAVVDAWMASPTHRENMLSPNYDDVGFSVQTGTLTGSDTILVVEEFGRRYGGTTATVQTPQTSPTPIQSSPTPAVIAVVTLVPSPTVVPSTPTPQIQKPQQPAVASVVNNPLVDSKSLKKNIAFGVLFLFIAVLIVDALIIERKKIARVVAHNLDHIIFLGIILAVIIIIGGGLIK